MKALKIELEPDHAAALFRLCDKLSPEDAMRFLYAHLPKAVREQQASQMVSAASRLLDALCEAGVRSAWPWIDGKGQHD